MPRKRKPPLTAEIANLRHGLAARTIAIPGLEEHGDWLTFRDSVIESLTPEGALELELACGVAESLWRRRRVARHEQHLVDIERQRDGAKAAWSQHEERVKAMEDEALADIPPAEAESVRKRARGFYDGLLANMKINSMITTERMLPDKDDLDRIIRYEAHLMRLAYHALHELQALQSHRRGEPAPLARLSVVGFGNA